MSAQHGLITHAQATGPGRMEPREVQALVSAGAWIAVRRGVYMYGDAWASLDQYRGRRLARSRAAHYAMRDAARHEPRFGRTRVWTSPCCSEHPDLVHVDSPETSAGPAPSAGSSTHLERATAGEPVVTWATSTSSSRPGWPSMSHASTASWPAWSRATRPCRSVSLAATSRPRLARMRYWPGVRSARIAVELADPGAESAGESLSRMLLVEMGLDTDPDPVRDERRPPQRPLRPTVGRHIVEFDGRIKYHRVDKGGVADRPAEQMVWAEKQSRTGWLASASGMSRLVWADVFGPGRAQAKIRLRREYDLTVRRFGVDTADLAPYVVRRASVTDGRIGRRCELPHLVTRVVSTCAGAQQTPRTVDP